MDSFLISVLIESTIQYTQHFLSLRACLDHDRSDVSILSIKHVCRLSVRSVVLDHAVLVMHTSPTSLSLLHGMLGTCGKISFASTGHGHYRGTTYFNRLWKSRASPSCMPKPTVGIVRYVLHCRKPISNTVGCLFIRYYGEDVGRTALLEVLGKIWSSHFHTFQDRESLQRNMTAAGNIYEDNQIELQASVTLHTFNILLCRKGRSNHWSCFVLEREKLKLPP